MSQVVSLLIDFPEYCEIYHSRPERDIIPTAFDCIPTMMKASCIFLDKDIPELSYITIPDNIKKRHQSLKTKYNTKATIDAELTGTIWVIREIHYEIREGLVLIFIHLRDAFIDEKHYED